MEATYAYDAVESNQLSTLNTITFCTIVTGSHLYFAEVLFASLKKHLKEGFALQFFVLVVDASHPHVHNSTIKVLTLDQLINHADAREIIFKYKADNDKLRWCLKPVLLHYLVHKLQTPVMYADSDLFFFADYSFLHLQLLKSSFLLSPHFRAHCAKQDESQFLKNFTDGLYNGGFIGASPSGTEALEWWMKACLYQCDQNAAKGLFDDQKYLDFIPSRFSHVHILQHRGCNIAAWNITDCKRTIYQKQILINNEWPIVFIHFSYDTIIGILYGIDKVLRPYLSAYADCVNQVSKRNDFIQQIEIKYQRQMLRLEPFSLKIRRWLSKQKQRMQKHLKA